MHKHTSRKPTRLQGYDYTQNSAYFVTICTAHREMRFGEIADGIMHLNATGEIVLSCWQDLPYHYPHAEYDSFVIMPNHVHAIIVLLDAPGVGEQRAGHKPAPTINPKQGLSQIIGSLKSYAAKRINKSECTPGIPLWQRSFHDHIIRDEADLNLHRHYIANNPARWADDLLHHTAPPS